MSENLPSDVCVRELMVACNYIGTSAELRGCVNDSVRMRQAIGPEALERDHGWAAQLTMLNEMQSTDTAQPTLANIQRELDALTDKLCDKRMCQRPVLGLVHLSGHGMQMRDRAPDEPDGLDEVYVPLDYLSGAYLYDDELHERLVHHMAPNVVCLVLGDMCHSGSFLDLEHRAEHNARTGTLWKSEALEAGPMHEGKCGNGGVCVSLGMCLDHQTSADAYFRAVRDFQGAGTMSFLHATEKGKVLFTKPLLQILRDMHAWLDENRFPQRPQLSCTERLDETTTLGDLLCRAGKNAAATLPHA